MCECDTLIYSCYL